MAGHTGQAEGGGSGERGSGIGPVRTRANGEEQGQQGREVGAVSLPVLYAFSDQRRERSETWLLPGCKIRLVLSKMGALGQAWLWAAEGQSP